MHLFTSYHYSWKNQYSFKYISHKSKPVNEYELFWIIIYQITMISIWICWLLNSFYLCIFEIFFCFSTFVHRSKEPRFAAIKLFLKCKQLMFLRIRNVYFQKNKIILYRQCNWQYIYHFNIMKKELLSVNIYIY